MKKILIYTTFGISKSIVRSEYLWLKNLLVKLKDEDTTFYFDSYFSKESSKKKRLKEFQEILQQPLVEYIDQEIDSVFFTAIPPAGFFGGLMNERDINNWMNLTEWSHKAKVFLRVADSEQSWVNIKNLYIQRFSKTSDFSQENFHIVDLIFFEKNQIAQKLLTSKNINWNNVYPLLNGNLSRWEEKFFVQNQEKKIFDNVPIETIKKNCIYLTDDLFFLIREQDLKIEYSRDHNNKLLFVGFLSGHNRRRESVLSNFLDIDLFIQTDNKGSLNPTRAVINDKKIPGDSKEYFEFMNQYLGGFFIGKGKSEKLDYVNKSIYDFLIAKIPVLIWNEIEFDLFKDLDCHFSKDNIDFLIFKLRDPIFREELLKKQRKIIFSNLETIESSIKKLKS